MCSGKNQFREFPLCLYHLENAGDEGDGDVRFTVCVQKHPMRERLTVHCCWYFIVNQIKYKIKSKRLEVGFTGPDTMQSKLTD